MIRTGILMPTCDRYIDVARLSIRLLDEYWSGHPQIHLCGIASSEAGALPLRCDPADWMAVVSDAARELASRGYGRVFLILDDQGPIDTCNAGHLNHTIPGWMSGLQAAYISLRGWDNRRYSPGTGLGPDYLHLQRQLPAYLWRFALHPALWDLDVLIRILEDLMHGTDLAQRSAWAFETRAGTPGNPCTAAWDHGTYRVCGRRMIAGGMNPVERVIRDGIDASARLVDAMLNRPVFRREAWPFALRKLAVSILKTDDVLYQGPYPLFFSGFLIMGRVNPHVVRYLRKKGRDTLAEEIEKAEPRSDT